MNESSIRKIGINFWNYFVTYSTYFSMGAVILLSVIDISDLDAWKVNILGIEEFMFGKLLYYITVLTALFFGVISISNTKEVKELEKDNSEKGNQIIDLENILEKVISDKEELFKSYLNLLFSNLNLTHSERISVYRVNNNQFVLMGRASENPNFEQPGRKSYPITEGFIGKGWAEGEFFIDNLPDPNEHSGNQYFKEINSISPINRDVVSNLSMQSRTYYVKRMKGYDARPKAVIVIESLNEQAFKKEFAEEKLQGVKRHLVMFIENSSHIEEREIIEKVEQSDAKKLIS